MSNSSYFEPRAMNPVAIIPVDRYVILPIFTFAMSKLWIYIYPPIRSIFTEEEPLIDMGMIYPVYALELISLTLLFTFLGVNLYRMFFKDESNVKRTTKT